MNQMELKLTSHMKGIVSPRIGQPIFPGGMGRGVAPLASRRRELYHLRRKRVTASKAREVTVAEVLVKATMQVSPCGFGISAAGLLYTSNQASIVFVSVELTK